MATQLMASPSEADSSAIESRFLKDRFRLWPTSALSHASKYLQPHSSLLPPSLSDKDPEPTIVDEVSSSSLLLLLLDAMQVPHEKGNACPQQEHFSLSSRAPLRPPNNEWATLSQPASTKDVNTTPSLFKASQPLYEYTIMPRKSKIDHAGKAPTRTTRASTRKRLISENAAGSTIQSVENSRSQDLTSLPVMGAYTDDPKQDLNLSRPEAQHQVQDAKSGDQTSSKDSRSAKQLPTSTSTDVGNIVHTGLCDSGLLLDSTAATVQTCGKRKRSNSDRTTSVSQNISKKRKTSVSTGHIQNSTPNQVMSSDLAASPDLVKVSGDASHTQCEHTEQSEIVNTKSPNVTSDSSELSDPPAIIGPIPTGLISPDEHFHSLRAANDASSGNLVRRSNRIRKISIKAIESGTTAKQFVDSNRRHSEPSAKKVTFADLPRQLRAASLEYSSIPISKKRKATDDDEETSVVRSQSTHSGYKRHRSTKSRQAESTFLSTLGALRTTKLADSVEASPRQPTVDAYGSDQAVRRPHRGSGRGGRGGHNGRGRGGRGRGGASGRGRGDSPERPVKHVLTTEEKSEIARLKRRQAELRHFFQFVGNQQTEILDVLAGRDLSLLMKKAKAHEKYPDYEEVIQDLGYHRDSKISQIKTQYEIAKQWAAEELQAERESIENQFRARIENARLEHIKGAAGDLAILKKAIAAGDDDAYTLAGSEADYFPRYHELPEAHATVRGYNSSKIEDEKPFRRDLPSFDEVAARDVMEDEVTRPVVEALHRKRVEEQAAIARERQARLDEEALEYSQSIDALADFANSDQGQRDITDINDYLNPRSMRAPQYGSFGLSSLADAAEAFARPLPTPQYGLLHPPIATSQYQPIYADFDHQRSRSLHFPPPPPKLYIPQNSSHAFSDQNSPLRSAGASASVGHGRTLLPNNKQYHTGSLPPTPQQSQSLTAMSTPTSTSARRSLRSIAPQPPAISSASSSAQSAAAHQTYTFVPPQQPPQSTHFAPTVAASKRSSPATTSHPVSAVTPAPAPMGAFPISAGPGYRSMSQPHTGTQMTYGLTMKSQPLQPTNEPRASGPKQGQGKIAMQFFNSIVDGNGKRALLPKP